MRAVAAQLYVELLRGGYTQVCEFHYLHHAEDGRAYDDLATLAWALADGPVDAGIGLTILQVLYERSGFAQDTLGDDQRRFKATPAFVHALYTNVQAARRPLVNAGVAIHNSFFHQVEVSTKTDQRQLQAARLRTGIEMGAVEYPPAPRDARLVTSNAAQ